MRNTQRYPVTVEETLKELTRIKNDLVSNNVCGDMAPLILIKLFDFVDQNRSQFEQFLSKSNEKTQ